MSYVVLHCVETCNTLPELLRLHVVNKDLEKCLTQVVLWCAEDVAGTLLLKDARFPHLLDLDLDLMEMADDDALPGSRCVLTRKELEMVAEFLLDMQNTQGPQKWFTVRPIVEGEPDGRNGHRH